MKSRSLSEELESVPSLKKRKRPPLRLRDLRRIPEARRHIAGHFRRGQLVLVYGPSGSCKTFLVMGWAHAIVTGLPYLGAYPVSQGPIAYLYSEGAQGCRKRCEAWLAHHDLEDLPDDAVFLPYCYDLTEPDEAAEIINEVEASIGRPALVVIDTLARNTTGDENSAKDTGLFVRNVDEFRSRWGATVVIVHHTGKSDSRTERGSSALRAAADAVFCVSGNEKHVSVEHQKSKDDRLLPPYTLEKRIIDLEVDDEGEPRSSLVLIGEDLPAVGTDRRDVTTEDRIRDLILELVTDDPINTTQAVEKVREAWPGRYSDTPVPGDRRITAGLKALKGNGLNHSKGPNNSDVWQSVLQ